MQVSLNWLNEFVDLSDLDVKQIAHELTMSGLEVEEVEEIKPKFTNIKTVKIEKLGAHPNSDRLHLVTLSNGSTVVCGAQNIKEGQIVPYASVGSKVLDRKTGEMFTLTPAVIRGVESQGMLCSAEELGVADRGYQDEEDGILILDKFGAAAGEDVEKLLGFDQDYILHVAPTTNRGDQMSVIGVARELSAIFDRPMNLPSAAAQNGTTSFKVEIVDEDVCKYYSIGVLKDIKIKPSPDWMQKRLVTSGIRAINNVVDITNYILMEYGIPLHAFDLNKLDGYLCVRRAKNDEKVTTLDGVERTLNPDAVLIATKKEGVCLAGVFGGANSEVDDKTTAIALEAAYFTPASNRKSARCAGYRSEACARFERGVDIEAIEPALNRAMQLLTEFADAKIEGVARAGSNKAENIEVTLRYAQVKKILGVQIEPEKCDNILQRLGFEILGSGKGASATVFKVPSWRVNDATREIDLIEEAARINGYDKITPTLPSKCTVAQVSHEQRVIKKIRETMSACGLDEIQTSSFVGKPLLERFGITYDAAQAVEILATDEHTMMRQTLTASILNCLKYNYDNGQKNFWGYEIGKTYFQIRPVSQKDTGVDEKQILAGAITGEINNSKWQEKIQTDFYTLKGVFEKLFSVLGISNRIKLTPGAPGVCHPHRSAQITILGQGIAGYFGQIHPVLKDKMKLNQDAFLFELDLDAIVSAVKQTTVRFKKLPQFPEVRRDLQFGIPKNQTYEEIVKSIEKLKLPHVRQVEVFDVYEGNMALHIYLRDDNATLTEDAINADINKIKHLVGL